MNIVIFEDSNIENLFPFSINHPSFEIRCGIHTNIERIVKCFDDDTNFFLIIRKELQDIYQKKYPRYFINPPNLPKGIYLNGAVIWNQNDIDKVINGFAFSCSGNLISFNNTSIIPEDTESFFQGFSKIVNDLFDKMSKVTSDIDVYYITYLWDVIYYSENIFLNDKKKISSSKLGEIHSSVVFINDDEIYISKHSQIGPNVVLDARKGNIFIDEHVIVKSGTIVEGPTYIGKGSIINPGTKLLGNVSIGHKCKIGGEVTNSIFQGYVNKQHDGFIGHSFIGEWVNIGANTNNSNLKNNYSKVNFKFSHEDKDIKTNKLFLDVMIGDYSRTGISTMLNTGTYIGLGANVFGYGFQKKYIPSFAWGEGEAVDFSKLIKTIEIMKSRRESKLEEIEIIFLENLYKNS